MARSLARIKPLFNYFKSDRTQKATCVLLILLFCLAFTLRYLLSADRSSAATTFADAPVIVRNGELDFPGSLVTTNRPSNSIVLFLPGSGPTDRNGNNPLGVSGSPYRQLAQHLAAFGIDSIRFDKRDILLDGSLHVDSIYEYVRDTNAFIKYSRLKLGKRCVWLLGHSEGGLIALLTASQNSSAVCGIILLNCPGRNFSEILTDQARKMLEPKAFLQVEGAIKSLRQGLFVKASGLPQPFNTILRSDVQFFLISEFSKSPVEIIAKLRMPIVIIQGMADSQIDPGEANLLHKAATRSNIQFILGMNHVLKVNRRPSSSSDGDCYNDIKCEVPLGLGEIIAKNIFSLAHRR